MKKWVVLFFICCLTNNFSQTSISPQFSELKGMEDQQGNTHLFYRIHTFSQNPISHWSNHIYHWDLNQDVDTFFIDDSGFETWFDENNKWVNDVDYWNNNPAEFIYCGGKHFGPLMSGSAYIKRFDGYLNYFGFYGSSVNYLDISLINDSLLYSGFYTDPNIIFEEELAILKSSNGGRSWDTVSVTYQFLSLCPTNESIYFVENESRELLRTTNSGNTFELVDSEQLPGSRFFYDANGTRIYRVIGSKLKISNSNGAQNTWQLAYSSNSDIHISVYDNSPGAAWLATGKNLFLTTDGGSSFQLMKSFESDIVGVHTNSDEPFVYAATKYRIYEIDLLEDSLKIIKSITPPSENYAWFPLEVGNLWAYENYYTENGIPYFAGYSWNWIDDSVVLQNGSEYFRMIERYTNGDKDTVFLRLDSLTAIIYAYSDETGQELLYEDLSAELGDSVCYEYNFIWGCPYVQSEEQFSIWGLNTLKKELYPNYSGWVCNHSLLKRIGLYTQGCGDLTTFYSNLIGCVIDGITYGDTTVVSVDDEENLIVTEYKLEQNYPNPFNPSTTIQYAIGSRQFVTLKVYDVLGNEIATLVNEELPAGEYEVEFNAAGLTSGIYFYQLRAGDLIRTKKMLMIK
jgi:hypothetical protein